ncbi:MAG: prepilin peptidase [Euryarchaeota archaeon]|nr:prepilin peptidase [Euryarchaeota archaeon]
MEIILLSGMAIALYTDLTTGLIKNWLIGLLFLLGSAFALNYGGPAAVLEGIAIGIGIALLTFIFTSPGGGDVKLSIAIGPWVGIQYFGIYIVSAWATRVILNFVVRLKMRNWNPVCMFTDMVTELKTWQITRQGENNFQAFQKAGTLCGGEPDVPHVPGAIWVFGGVLGVIIFKLF